MKPESTVIDIRKDGCGGNADPARVIATNAVRELYGTVAPGLSLHGNVLFLHSRATLSGTNRIVIVEFAVIPHTMVGTVWWTTIEPRAPSMQMPCCKTGCVDGFFSADDDHVFIKSGRVDVNNDSHFSFDIISSGKASVVHGWLTDDGGIEWNQR